MEPVLGNAPEPAKGLSWKPGKNVEKDFVREKRQIETHLCAAAKTHNRLRMTNGMALAETQKIEKSKRNCLCFSLQQWWSALHFHFCFCFCFC